ncbi:hypothetical protein V9T40_010617 [Parthenolecanium corni]|uniref:Uncharacterized protein n=1 Tax=Parthenolecanium corni TaxID=536013 RepID=A0AAN9T5I9_9HEMI
MYGCKADEHADWTSPTLAGERLRQGRAGPSVVERDEKRRTEAAGEDAQTEADFAYDSSSSSSSSSFLSSNRRLVFCCCHSRHRSSREAGCRRRYSVRPHCSHRPA